jgi:hypothetical protein
MLAQAAVSGSSASRSAKKSTQGKQSNNNWGGQKVVNPAPQMGQTGPKAIASNTYGFYTDPKTGKTSLINNSGAAGAMYNDKGQFTGFNNNYKLNRSTGQWELQLPNGGTYTGDIVSSDKAAKGYQDYYNNLSGNYDIQKPTATVPQKPVSSGNTYGATPMPQSGAGTGNSGGGFAPSQPSMDVQKLWDTYQKKTDEANAANEKRYNEGLGLYDQMVAGYKNPGYGQGTRDQINQRQKQDTASGMQSLVNSGLYNSTIAPTVAQAASEAAQRSMNDLNDQITQNVNSALSQKAQFIANRNDVGPDLGNMANIISQIGEGAYGGNGTSSGGYGSIVPQTGGSSGYGGYGGASAVGGSVAAKAAEMKRNPVGVPIPEEVANKGQVGRITLAKNNTAQKKLISRAY